MNACLELLVEGMVELRVSDVADRSGVNRGTVYRWWPTTTDLLTDAVLFHYDRRIDAPDLGSWEQDVRWVMTETANLVDEPVERAIMVAMTTRRYPEFNELMHHAWRRSLPQWIEMVERAIRRGEVYPDTDPTSLVSMMMAPLMTTALFGGERTSPDTLEHLIDLVLRATAADVSGGWAPS